MMPVEYSQFEAMLMQVCQPRGWQVGRDAQGQITVLIAVEPQAGRTQTVYISYGRDTENAPMGFFWSICAQADTVRDWAGIARANVSLLPYGAYGLKDQFLVIQEGLFLGGADPNTIAKILWHVAKFADAHEKGIYGYQNRL
jgi:hypothetical protein